MKKKKELWTKETQEQIDKTLEMGEKLKEKLNSYTGFTTKCRKCHKEIKTKYIGKTKEGIPSYLLTCDCK